MFYYIHVTKLIYFIILFYLLFQVKQSLDIFASKSSETHLNIDALQGFIHSLYLSAFYIFFCRCFVCCHDCKYHLNFIEKFRRKYFSSVCWLIIMIYLISLDCCNKLLQTRQLKPEKAMAPHSSTLAWKIPWTEEPGRLQSMGSHRVGHD